MDIRKVAAQVVAQNASDVIPEESLDSSWKSHGYPLVENNIHFSEDADDLVEVDGVLVWEKGGRGLSVTFEYAKNMRGVEDDPGSGMDTIGEAITDLIYGMRNIPTGFGLPAIKIYDFTIKSYGIEVQFEDGEIMELDEYIDSNMSDTEFLQWVWE